MSTATLMVTHLRRPLIDSDTVETLTEVAQVARQCADACLDESADELARCIALNLDVADIAPATANMVVRLGEPAALLAALEACRATLQACASVCRSHGTSLRHCVLSADACERAEEQCVRMSAAVSHHNVAARRAAQGPLSR